MSNEKNRIILRVNRKLREENQSNSPEQGVLDYLTKARNYTGLHAETLVQLEGGDINVNVDNVDRGFIFNTLYRFHLRQRLDGGRLPTTYELFDAVVKSGAIAHMDIGLFRKMLVKMDFIWKRIKPNRMVVMERPEVKFQRFDYLSQITRSRVERYDNIVFVDEVAYNQDMFVNVSGSRDLEGANIWQQRVIYAVGVKTISCLKDVNEFSESVFENWILKELCPTLSQPTVVVIRDLDHHKAKLLETPTLYSSKSEIINWLYHHDVIYHEDMSKFELYSLAEEYTDLEEQKYKIDSILTARGHTLLRFPKYVEDINPATLVFNMFKKNWSLQEGQLADVKTGQTSQVAKSCFHDVMLNSSKFLEGYTISAVGEEKRMVLQEMDMDMNLDRLMMDSSQALIFEEDSDFPSCSDDE